MGLQRQLHQVHHPLLSAPVRGVRGVTPRPVRERLRKVAAESDREEAQQKPGQSKAEDGCQSAGAALHRPGRVTHLPLQLLVALL